MASGALDAHDDTTIALAAWATGLRREAIPSGPANALVWHHLDSVGCAIGAIGAAPCVAARALAAEGATPGGVSVVGLTERVSAEIGAFANASSEIGGGQNDHAQKWDPRNRETADHSLPYMCAAALVEGRVQAESYLPERFLDPSLRLLMNKIEVVEYPEITASWVRTPAHDITIRLVSGQARHMRVDYP